jgi:uncharacterized phiE125 gp8 family phage protein
MGLITLSDLKTYLEITDTTFDTILNDLIEAVSEEFETYTSRKFIQATYTDEYFDGDGTRILWLPNWPIISVTSVVENDVTLTEGNEEDYIVYKEEGYLWRVGTVWAEGVKNIKITYTAGYLQSDIPKDLVLAVKKQVAFEWQKQKSKRWGEQARTFPDGSITFIISELLPDVQDILNRYKRMRI